MRGRRRGGEQIAGEGEEATHGRERDGGDGGKEDECGRGSDG